MMPRRACAATRSKLRIHSDYCSRAGDSSGGWFNSGSSTNVPGETQCLIEMTNTTSSGTESTVMFCLQPQSPSLLINNSPLST